MGQVKASLIAATALVGAFSQPALATNFPAGALYTMSNSSLGNEIIVYTRNANGRLQSPTTYPTGGAGTGAGLGNQSAVILTEDERFLLAVNAGSNDISVFEVTADGLTLVDRKSSGGTQPVSLTEHDNMVYVLNAGSDTIQGFFLTATGRLLPRPQTTRPLSGSNTGPAQIAFSQDGTVLVITEKNTNTILTYRIVLGVPAEPQTITSAAPTPFGFAFGPRDQLIVSEAAGGGASAGSVSSYEVSRRGDVSLISAAVGTTQTAACWIVVSPDGRFAYTTNTGSGNISSYRIGFDGTLTLAAPSAASIGTGSAPIDMARTADGQFLYSLNAGNETISAFRINTALGTLTPIAGVVGLPDGANGLAVR